MTGGVTIAVTTKDRPELTLRAVESARLGAPEARIVVVDSGSAEENLQRLQAGLGSIQLHTGAYPNAAAARNAALGLVDSEFVGFLDSDDLMRAEKITCLRPLLLRDVTAVLAVGRTGFIDAQGRPMHEFSELQAEHYRESERIGTSYAGQCVRFTAFTSATLMRRAAVERIGGYDEALPAMEDVDLYLRLSLIGTIATARCIAADYRVWTGSVGAVRSAEGIVAVASKHLANLPIELPRHERRSSQCGLNMRAALSLQHLLRASDARRSLVRAARADPVRALRSRAFWRIFASSLVPRGIIERRRAASRYSFSP